MAGYVAIAAIHAFTWGVEPTVIAFLAVALGLPCVVVGPGAGVLTDRLPVKLVLIHNNLSGAAVTFSLALAPNWQILLGLVMLRGTVDAFFTPAKQAAIKT